MTFTASVTFRFRSEDGAIEQLTFSQDVTDEMTDGADSEALVDRIYWNQIDGKYDLIDFLSGGISAS